MADVTLTEAQREAVIRDVYAFAAEQMRGGASNQLVKQRLIERGLSAEAAAVVVNNLAGSRYEAADGLITKGALWLIGGIVVTVGSIALGHGSFVITWGAIVYGIVCIARGLSLRD